MSGLMIQHHQSIRSATLITIEQFVARDPKVGTLSTPDRHPLTFAQTGYKTKLLITQGYIFQGIEVPPECRNVYTVSWEPHDNKTVNQLSVY